MKESKRIMVGLLNLAILLFLPLVVAGITIALMSGIVSVLTGVDFHTIINTSFAGLVFFMIWIITLIYMGDHLFKND